MWLQRGFCSSTFTLRLWPLWLQPPEGKGSLIQGLGGGGGGGSCTGCRLSTCPSSEDGKSLGTGWRVPDGPCPWMAWGAPPQVPAHLRFVLPGPSSLKTHPTKVPLQLHWSLSVVLIPKAAGV